MSEMIIEKIMADGVKLTPMMNQYYQIKKNYRDTILFFRMGDFYEVFFEDAKLTAKLLNITLTHRGKLGGHPIPMAGMPHHAASTYIDRITGLGQKVAICEQVENPKDAVGIVKRAVTQVVGPAIPYDLEKSQNTEPNFIIATYSDKQFFYISALDYTTGDFIGHAYKTFSAFFEKIKIIRPKEIISYLGQFAEYPTLDTYLEQNNILKTHLSSEYFSAKFTEIYIEKLIPNYKHDQIIKSSIQILNPIGALAYYISSTQMLDEYVHIKNFRLEQDSDAMKVSLPTLHGLEILPKYREEYKESLLGHIDKTQSALGTRKLREILIAPLQNKENIQARQNVIHYFMQNQDQLADLREELSEIRDLERILAKLASLKITPSDLLNIANTIQVYFAISPFIQELPNGKAFLNSPDETQTSALAELSEMISKTINEEPGASLEKGNLILSGYSKTRDHLYSLTQDNGKKLLQLEEKYKTETGISKLRVKHNNVAGFFIEISKSHCHKAPQHFNRKQTLTNCERFVTEELAIYETESLSAKEKLLKFERKIFNELIILIKKNIASLQKLANLLALVDVFQSLAWLAIQEGFCCPKLNTKNQMMKIKGAWHPLIKALIKDQFITHDLNLNKDRFFALITGPNMAGKTTVMREVAIIQILAQIGSFVPAESCEISLCDYLFSRLGASDNILKGQSTFMVEMAETAEILRHATAKSLIILDEVGRGTSTFDGLSIAWALVEHLAQKTMAITLFATHYHELIELINTLPHACNLTVEVSSENDQVQFLYGLIEGGATESYGIHVAQLAGIPESLIKRSNNILSNLEKKPHNDSQVADATTKEITPNNEVIENFAGYPAMQLSFLPAANQDSKMQIAQKSLKRYQELKKELNKINVLNMTPLEALNKIHQLKELF